jgi:beta-glucanase (GH16 family)
MKSQDLFSHQYGKVEARIMAPYGQGIWPAFWILGQDIGTAGWPACGEIDIMEMIGGGSDRDNKNYGTAHWDNGGHQSSGGSVSTVWPEKLSDNYHVYGIEWDAAQIRWYFDGVQYYSVNIDPAAMSEFQAPMFIILNIAVGGSWPGSPDATTVFPQKMYVDWVRWWNFQ